LAISDGLIISLVGMGVVFFGLLVTSWLISAISLVPAWLERRRHAVPPQAVALIKETVQPVITPTPSPDTAAVIAALLEVEMRLHGGDRIGRFTFRRDPQARDWSVEGGRRDNKPVRGVR
jgi:Na+-transporting methylmalonyl-CoA/oxaloacetate decarboxylase gamma subunit